MAVKSVVGAARSGDAAIVGNAAAVGCRQSVAAGLVDVNFAAVFDVLGQNAVTA